MTGLCGSTREERDDPNDAISGLCARVCAAKPRPRLTGLCARGSPVSAGSCLRGEGVKILKVTAGSESARVPYRHPRRTFAGAKSESGLSLSGTFTALSAHFRSLSLRRESALSAHFRSARIQRNRHFRRTFAPLGANNRKKASSSGHFLVFSHLELTEVTTYDPGFPSCGGTRVFLPPGNAGSCWSLKKNVTSPPNGRGRFTTAPAGSLFQRLAFLRRGRDRPELRQIHGASVHRAFPQVDCSAQGTMHWIIFGPFAIECKIAF
jgi:hypothetical protein